MTDYISRAEAIEAMCSYCLDRDTCSRFIGTCDSAKAVAELPSADAVSRFHHDMEVKELKHQIKDQADAVQGEWQPSSIKSDMWHCSVCGSPLMTDDINETHFCPNCGARMKGGDAKMETEPPKPVHPLYMQQSRHDDGRMTREEAKQWLEAMKSSYALPIETYEAIDMAIDALSQPIVAKHFDNQSGYIYCSPQIAENVKVVVRCKDCIHWKADNEVFELGFCCVFPQKWVAETFYCADGERGEP